MEAIGQLTGGVAHDFNNLLTIIIGNLETLERAVSQPAIDRERAKGLIDSAARGAQRAAALTQRLLAFSRQQPLEPKVVDISQLIVGMSELLRRALGEQITVESRFGDRLGSVNIDPNQFEVAIINLAVNARDAMPNGGKLVVEATNASLDERYASDQSEVLPGDYVVITITDTGRGMPPDVLKRAFEPFFTTKDIGHGTGLGLSQVYGFVKQSGGQIRMMSEVGLGTTVVIYLPRAAGVTPKDMSTNQKSAPAARRGFETILVVEDDVDVRVHTREILRELGYETLEAETAREALGLLASHDEVRLLFTDIGLPGGMSGRQLAQVAREKHPGLRVLLTSGYAQNASVEGHLEPGVQLISKPFTFAGLAAKIRIIIDTPERSKRILFVEDEWMIQMMATEYLEGLGFRVDAVASATQALAKLEQLGSDIDVAIIDLGLPDQKGDRLFDEIRRTRPTLPVLIATGYADEPLRRKLQGDDWAGLVPKPYGPKQLADALADLHVRA